MQGRKNSNEEPTRSTKRLKSEQGDSSSSLNQAAFALPFSTTNTHLLERQEQLPSVSAMTALVPPASLFPSTNGNRTSSQLGSIATSAAMANDILSSWTGMAARRHSTGILPPSNELDLQPDAARHQWRHATALLTELEIRKIQHEVETTRLLEEVRLSQIRREMSSSMHTRMPPALIALNQLSQASDPLLGNLAGLPGSTEISAFRSLSLPSVSQASTDQMRSRLAQAATIERNALQQHQAGQVKQSPVFMPMEADMFESQKLAPSTSLKRPLQETEYEGNGSPWGRMKKKESKDEQGIQVQQWEDLYEQLRRYREIHGHCLVPQHTADNLRLARWVKRQRYQYKLMTEGKLTNMTKDRVKKLKAIGFVWDSHSATWEERLGELKEYKKVNGHCNVPITYKENRKLAAWVKCQRRQYKLLVGGEPSNITDERVRALESIGFEWRVRKPDGETG